MRLQHRIRGVSVRVGVTRGVACLVSVLASVCAVGSTDTAAQTEAAQTDAAQANRTAPFVLRRPSGPFGVGVATWHLVDQSRAETATLDPHDVRELIVHLRYPIDRAFGTRQAPYFLNRLEGRLNGDDALGLPTFFDQVVDSTRLDASLSCAQGRWPVVVFSPGLGAPLPLYTTIMEDLASHGFIVVGIVHPYAVGITVLPGGRIAGQADAPDYYDALTLNAIWTADARFVLDNLDRLNARPQSEWRGKLDLHRMAMVGHSFGGATAASLALVDPRIRAAVNLDGRFWGPVVDQGIDQPFMLFNSELPVEDPSRAPFLQHLRGPGYDVHIAGTGHNNYSDQGPLLPLLLRYVPDLPIDAIGLGTIDGTRAIDITTTYLQAFLQRYLRGRPSPLLDGPSPHFPEVTLNLYNAS